MLGGYAMSHCSEIYGVPEYQRRISDPLTYLKVSMMCHSQPHKNGYRSESALKLLELAGDVNYIIVFPQQLELAD